MNFKKLLALLLALAMLLCCFAACDSSDKDDDDEDEKVEDEEKDEDDEDEDEDKDDEDKDDEDDDDKSSKDDEDDEEDEDDEDDRDTVEEDDDEDDRPQGSAVSDEALIEGEWYLNVDIADIIYANAGIEVDGSLEICLVYDFDGVSEYHYSLKEAPSDREVEDFVEAYFDAVIEYFMDYYNCSTEAEFEELVKQNNFEDLEAYKESLYAERENEINTMINLIKNEYDDDYEFDKDEGILVIENTEYYVELNSRATEMEIVECDGNPSFVGFVFEKQ